MSITSKEIVLSAMRSQGKADALDLRSRAPEMDGTGLIAEEAKIPAWSASKDYSAWAAGSPVTDGGQVWTLLQPHNAANYTGTPAELRALWGLAHTTDPARAKPYVAPYGTSGLYMSGECCTEDGTTYRSKVDSNAYSPADYPANWETVTE